MMKKVLCLALAMALALSLAPSALAATDTLTFSDVPATHWAYDEITEMTAQGLFTGKSAAVDGVAKFAPNDTMTRAEFVTVVTRMIFGEELAARENPAGAPWWRKYYDIAVENRILNAGELDGGNLDRPMTRQEMALVIGRAAQGFDYYYYTASSGIPDWNAIADEYKPAVLFSYGNELLTGVDEEGTFDPNGTLNRAAGATVVYRLIEKVKTDGRKDWYARHIMLSTEPSKVEYGIMAVADWNPANMAKTITKGKELADGYNDPTRCDSGVVEGEVALVLGAEGKGYLVLGGYITDHGGMGNPNKFPTVTVTGLPEYDGDWLEAANEWTDTFLSETVSDTVRTNTMAIVKDIQERAYNAGLNGTAAEFNSWMLNLGCIEVGDEITMTWGEQGLQLEEVRTLIARGFDDLIVSFDEFDWYNPANKPQ